MTMRQRYRPAGTRFLLSIVMFVLLCTVGSLDAQGPPILQVQLRQSLVQGLPISWGSNNIIMMDSSGAIFQFPPTEVVQHQQLRDPFRPLDISTLTTRLSAEFGNGYRIARSGPYVIVAPSSLIERWSRRFVTLYNGMQTYFSARGLPLQPCPFPLVAIVFSSRSEFDRYASKEGSQVTPNTLGYYSLLTNRIALYNMPSQSEEDWYTTSTTLVHEATHQTAYNSGLHNRLAETPLWIVEGMASMFEAPGVFDSGNFRGLGNRINRARHEGFKRHFSNVDQMHLAIDSMIASDKYFDLDPDRAYALAWAVSFYLAEKDIRAYSLMLRDMGKLPPGGKYSAAQRANDFQDWTNTRTDLLAREVWKFLNE